MDKFNFYTLGVYGYSAEEFFDIIKDNNIDTFCDVRRRRAVRGSEYSFVNSNKLQNKLAGLKINYLHYIDLSPNDEMRKKQMEEDRKKGVAQRKRESLSDSFVKNYNSQVLEKFDFESFLSDLRSHKAKNVLLFCVEKNPSACHRSLIADHLADKYSFKIRHL